MLGLKKLKSSYLSVLKEYPISIICFMIGTILFSIETCSSKSYSYYVDNGFHDVMLFFYLMVFGIVLCESIHQYKLHHENGYAFKNPMNLLMYTCIGGMSFIVSFGVAYFDHTFVADRQYNEFILLLYNNLLWEITLFYVITSLLVAIYYMFKGSGLSFELFCAKVFGGLMKTFIIYGILALGILMVLGIFSTLIWDFSDYNVIETVESLLIGIVLFPCCISAVSDTREDISKFTKVILSYVFTSLLAAAFFIIYIYIFKIVITWTFPSNEVFSILTALFVSGVVIWTMASGCCSDNMKKLFKFMPFLFVPFIILQIMCIYMRVHSYGLTLSRYMGCALIIFEIAYFVMYTASIVMNKRLTHSLIFMIIGALALCLFVPGINYRNMILISQKPYILAYLVDESDSSPEIKYKAYEAYWAVNSYCGYKGTKYINAYLTDSQIDDMRENGYEEDNVPEYVDNGYYNISCDHNIFPMDVSDFSSINHVELYYDFDEEDYDLTDMPITDTDNNEICRDDLSSLINELRSLEDANPDNLDDRYEDVISVPITLKDGSTFIINYIYIYGYKYEDEPIDNITIFGYILK